MGVVKKKGKAERSDDTEQRRATLEESSSGSGSSSSSREAEAEAEAEAEGSDGLG